MGSRKAETTDGARRVFDVLERATSLAATSESIDEYLNGLLAIVVDVLRIDYGVVMLRDGERLRPRVAIGVDMPVSHDVRLGSSALKAMTATRGGLFRACPETQAILRHGSNGDAARDLHGLPLAQGDDLVGVIALGSTTEPAFSGVQAQLLQLLGAQATAAIVQHTAQETLREAVRMRDDVLAVVAHDLRNPLNVIGLAAQSVLPRLTEPSTRRPVEQILRATQRADRLIRDLLEVGAIEGGRLSIETRPSEVTDLVLSALESQQSLAANASVILATDVSPELPAIDGDSDRLLEVLENLIGNAIKFTAPGGTVTVGASLEGDQIMVWVKDTGAGIPPEQLPHLFDRFWQAKKRDRRGSGLGLSICKGIVDAHGGRIWAESEVGVGTTLSFTVPALTRTHATPVPAVATSTILLVDDRNENLIALKAILDRPEYRILTASSGEEALRLALRERLSLALIDIAMPMMDGFEVASHLKALERCRDIPILFITAFGDDPDEIHRAYAAGGADYLVKPLDADIVRKKVAVFARLSARRLLDSRLH